MDIEQIFLGELNSWTDKAIELNLPQDIKYGDWMKKNKNEYYNKLYQSWRFQLNRIGLELKNNERKS